MADYTDLVLSAISNTPGTSGNLVLTGSGLDDYRSLSAEHDGREFEYTVHQPGVGRETRLGVYTHSTRTLTRGTLLTSTTGASIDLTSAARVAIVVASRQLTFLDRLQRMVTPGGRLTTESGVPVSTSDRTAQSTLYYTPFTHDGIVLWDGADWRPITFTERSLALSGLIANRPYDVFGFLNAGALSLELLAWTNDTTRATAVTLQDGRYCLSGNKTRLLLGTIYTTSATTTEDSAGGTTTQVGGKRFVSNVYNKVARDTVVLDTADNWTYASATIRKANGATGALNAIEFVSALPEQVYAVVHGVVYLSSNVNRAAKVGVGVDATTAFSGLVQGGYCFFNSAPPRPAIYAPVFGSYRGRLSAGFHRLHWLEQGADGDSIFLGDNGADGQQAGLYATVQS